MNDFVHVLVFRFSTRAQSTFKFCRIVTVIPSCRLTVIPKNTPDRQSENNRLLTHINLRSRKIHTQTQHYIIFANEVAVPILIVTWVYIPFTVTVDYGLATVLVSPILNATKVNKCQGVSLTGEAVESERPVKMCLTTVTSAAF